MFASVACGPVRFGRVTKIVAVATSLALLLSPPTWADQTTGPGTPTKGYYVDTSQQLTGAQLLAGQHGTCGYQYNSAINQLNLAALALNATGAAAAVTGALAQGVLDEAQGTADGVKSGGFTAAGLGLD